MTGAGRIGSTVQTIVSQGRGLTLIIQQGAAFQPPVQVVFTGSELSEKALILALDLGVKKGMPVAIHMLGSCARNGHTQARVQKIVADYQVQAVAQSLPENADLTRIAWAVGQHGTGPLFLPCEGPELSGEGLQELIGSLPNPVFLVRF